MPLVRDGDWSKAAEIDGFVKIGKSAMKRKPHAKRRTRVLVCHDMKNLKVKFVCGDPDTTKLEGRAPDANARESFPGGDHVEFAITTNKGRHGWQFGIDCRGNRADIRDGDIAANAKWTSDVKVTKRAYEVELSIDFESIGAEITQENRFGVCFARMALPRAPDEKREFSSWKGDHPQSLSPVGSIFISME